MILITVRLNYKVNLNAEGTKHKENPIQIPRTHPARRHTQTLRRKRNQRSILPQLHTLGQFSIIPAQETGSKAGEKTNQLIISLHQE